MPELKTPPPGQAPEARARQRRVYLLQGAAALLVLIVAVFAAQSLLQTSPTAGSRPVPERQARLVEVVALEPTDYQPTVTGWGTLRPARELILRAQVSGAVEELSPELEPGMTVRPGDQLVQLESASYQAALTQACSALAEAEANLALEQGQQAVARREFELLTAGPESFDSGPGLALREPQLAIARAAVEGAQARMAEARLDLDRTVLKAPFDAMVTTRSVTLGAQVSASTDIARLVGVETWWVEVLVPADRLTWLDNAIDATEPVPVVLRQPGVWNPGQSRRGVLLRVLQELEDQGNLARLLVAVDDPLNRQAKPLGQTESREQTGPGQPTAPRLLLGSFLRADIQGRPLEDVFVLEPRWLRENNSVWLMDEDGKLQIRPVRVLYRDEEAVVISAADGTLHAGDKLVTNRFSAPAEGMPLRTEARTDQAGGDTPEPDSADAEAKTVGAKAASRKSTRG